MNCLPIPIALVLFIVLMGSSTFTSIAAPADKTKPMAKPAPAPIVYEAAPSAVLAPKSWQVAELKGNTFVAGEWRGKPVISAAGKSLLLITPVKLDVNTRIRAQFRFVTQTTSSLQLAVGLSNAGDLKEKGRTISITGGPTAIGWAVSDPRSTARLPVTSGQYRPQFIVERSLTWPEALRANVEADMVASTPLYERLLTLDVVLRDHGYEVSLDGIPLTTVDSPEVEPRGLARIMLSPNVELQTVTTSPAPLDKSWLHHPVALDSVLNAGKIDGAKVVHASFAKSGQFEHGGVPFRLSEPNSAGNDHVDVGASWFRQGNVTGRYSGRGTDALAARWPGALLKDPARITVRLPMARYRALHLLAAADAESDSVPIVTAQFYRAQAGFPKNFVAQVPAFSAQSTVADAIAVQTTDSKQGRLYHITIPIDAGALAEFDDLDFVDVELTKQVMIYRASPDPMYYSW
ncbi:MAG: hypothetical protein JNM18_14885, partial [Planctomycetaceae bacterium]|nr:hypothetical protein [Planctomycetaceae bacterium]